MCITKEELKELNESHQNTLDEVKALTKAMLSSRDNSPSISTAIIELKDEIKLMKEDIKKTNKSIEPVLKIVNTADNAKSGIVWVAGLLMALGVIGGFFYQIKKWALR